MNLIDVAAVAPYWSSIAMKHILEDFDESKISNIRRVLQILRVLRMFRVLKLARHSTGLQALGYTFQKSYRELGVLSMENYITVV